MGDFNGHSWMRGEDSLGTQESKQGALMSTSECKGNFVWHSPGCKEVKRYKTFFFRPVNIGKI